MFLFYSFRFRAVCVSDNNVDHLEFFFWCIFMDIAFSLPFAAFYVAFLPLLMTPEEASGASNSVLLFFFWVPVNFGPARPLFAGMGQGWFPNRVPGPIHPWPQAML